MHILYPSRLHCGTSGARIQDMKIKEGLESDYKKYVQINEDPYSAACVKAGERVGALLDEGKSADDALEGLKGDDLSGAMAGAAIAGVVNFHPRGDELKVAWNKDCGGTGEEKGTIDPSIITIG